MANRPDDDLSATKAPDDAETSAPAELSPALAWAAGRFEFDPAGREPQSGVESMQKWLLNQDVDVALDAMLGPQTLSALERAYAEGADRNSMKAETGHYSTSSPGEGTQDEQQDARQTDSAATPPADDAPVSARPVALSDSAISDVAEDRLGFTPYVEAVADFVLAEQTRPPLAIAINAAWGQGKTSFMNMLEGQLKRAAAGTTTRVATTWFNPWKYSEPEQVWAAFVANVTRCLQANLTPPQYRRFKWGRFKQKWVRNADFALRLRMAVACLFVLLILSLPFTLDLPAFHASFKDKDGVLGAFYAASASVDGWLWWVLFVPFALLSVLYGYITFTRGLGLNLLEYVEKTDFKDKIGTLSQFESEMRRLADAIPDDLKIVVFIDDLDRCNGKVLGEIIEALQLADVSRSCIFVMGMDLGIVADAIENERRELAKSTGNVAHMEHGSGYKFLEKIIQARLALPTHGDADMARLVTSAMGHEKEAAQTAPAGDAVAAEPRSETLLETAIGTITGTARTKRETPGDSQPLIETAQHYGSRHFKNPRRLKRFINGFRLQAYLAAATQPESTRVDQLARFLVLAEKWPALLNHLVEENKGAEILQEPDSKSTTFSMAMQIRDLRDDDRQRVAELLQGRGGSDPLTAGQIRFLATWSGFSYYPGLER